jgi:hypothetical protein
MRRAAAALLAAALLVTPLATAQLTTRTATFTWDKNSVLKGTFSYKDAIDEKIKKRLGQGLAVNIVMRGYVYRTGSTTPIALTASTCRVAYELWNETFTVVVNGVTKKAVVNINGVYRLCTDMVDLPISDRKTLKGSGADYYLAVKVEVNPVSPKLLKEMQAWVTRPLGVSGTIGAGDALFATFVSVFMQKSVASADKIVEFRTATFPP